MKISRNEPKKFLSLTGYTLEEFAANTLKHIRLKDNREKNANTTYQNSCLPSLEDKLLFILIYLREAMKQEVR